MKKLVLSIALSMIALATLNAQNSFTFIGSDGSAPADGPYYFNGGAVTLTTATVSGKIGYDITGTTTGYYAGGWGQTLSSYTFSGIASTTSFVFTYQTSDPVQVKFQFKNSTDANIFGYQIDLSSSSTGANFATITVPASNLLEIVNNNPTGDAISTSELQTINEWQIVFNYQGNGGVGNGGIFLTDVKLINTPSSGSITSISNNSVANGITISPNPSNQGKISIVSSFNVNGVTVVNSQGVQVNAPFDGNSVNTAGLTPGVYTLLINTDNGTAAKKVIVE